MNSQAVKEAAIIKNKKEEKVVGKLGPDNTADAHELGVGDEKDDVAAAVVGAASANPEPQTRQKLKRPYLGLVLST